MQVLNWFTNSGLGTKEAWEFEAPRMTATQGVKAFCPEVLRSWPSQHPDTSAQYISAFLGGHVAVGLCTET